MKKPKHIALKIAILTRVRHTIDRGSARGICYALILDGCERRTTPAYRAARNQLLQYVKEALVGFAWLDSWQVNNGCGKRSETEIRHDRLAWIDWMIADYQKWG